MRTFLVVLAVLVALVVLPIVAVPLLIAAGFGIGVAAVVGSAALFAIPIAVGAAILGLLGLMLRLAFGLIGLIFSLIGAVLSIFVTILFLPFVLLPVILPLLLVGGLIWWAVRASRQGDPKSLPATAAV